MVFTWYSEEYSGICSKIYTLPSENVAPTAVADFVTTEEDITVTGNVLTNDSDSDGGTLSASLVGENGGASNGTVTIDNDGSFSYTPEANFNGTDEFTYQVSDGQGGTSTATVTVTVTSDNDAATISGDISGTTLTTIQP